MFVNINLVTYLKITIELSDAYASLSAGTVEVP